MKQILIVCIGNDLVGDDGIGSAVWRQLSSRTLPDRIRLVNLGLGGLDLLEIMEGESLLIVVDAVQLGGVPGTVYCLESTEMTPAPGRPVSGHGIGLQEALKMGAVLYPERMVEKAFFVGIEGKCFDQLGRGLSPKVEAAIPDAIRIIENLVAGE